MKNNIYMTEKYKVYIGAILYHPFYEFEQEGYIIKFSSFSHYGGVTKKNLQESKVCEFCLRKREGIIWVMDKNSESFSRNVPIYTKDSCEKCWFINVFLTMLGFKRYE